MRALFPLLALAVMLFTAWAIVYEVQRNQMTLAALMGACTVSNLIFLIYGLVKP